MWETGFSPWVGKIPWRREWLPTAVFLCGEFHEHRSLVGYSLWSLKELDMTECLRQSVWVSNWQGVNLWWLILCVNLTRLEGAQIIWSDIVLGVSIECFWVKLIFEMVDWSKVDCLLYSGWVSSNHLKAWVEQKGWGRGNSLAARLIEMGHWFPPAFGLRLKHQLFLSLQPRGFQTETYTSSSPGSPSCQQQILGLLSVHNHSQSL